MKNNMENTKFEGILFLVKVLEAHGDIQGDKIVIIIYYVGIRISICISIHMIIIYWCCITQHMLVNYNKVLP